MSLCLLSNGPLLAIPSIIAFRLVKNVVAFACYSLHVIACMFVNFSETCAFCIDMIPDTVSIYMQKYNNLHKTIAVFAYKTPIWLIYLNYRIKNHLF